MNRINTDPIMVSCFAQPYYTDTRQKLIILSTRSDKTVQLLAAARVLVYIFY